MKYSFYLSWHFISDTNDLIVHSNVHNEAIRIINQDDAAALDTFWKKTERSSRVQTLPLAPYNWKERIVEAVFEKALEKDSLTNCFRALWARRIPQHRAARWSLLLAAANRNCRQIVNYTLDNRTREESVRLSLIVKNSDLWKILKQRLAKKGEEQWFRHAPLPEALLQIVKSFLRDG